MDFFHASFKTTHQARVGKKSILTFRFDFCHLIIGFFHPKFRCAKPKSGGCMSNKGRKRRLPWRNAMNNATGHKGRIFLQKNRVLVFQIWWSWTDGSSKREINEEVWSRITTNSFHASCVIPTSQSSGLLSKIALSQSSTSCPKSSISILSESNPLQTQT